MLAWLACVLLAGVVLLAVVTVSPASARVRQAESVLPPGQSGFFSLVTGPSPHLADQTALFTSFRFKPAGFFSAGSPETPRPGVRIVRDAYGVPSVTGTTAADVWFGAGYAVAQDRLAELELFRRQTEGRLAEILGRGRLDGRYRRAARLLHESASCWPSSGASRPSSRPASAPTPPG